METISVVREICAPLLEPNIDTDVIIRVERLMAVPRGELGPYCFEAWRYVDAQLNENPDFVLNRPRFKPARILLAGENFGCGSSREAAVWALMDYGFRCIISSSFGDIFHANCLQNGLLPVVLPKAGIERLAATLSEEATPTLTVDLIALKVASARDQFRFEIKADERTALLQGLDDISMSLQHADAVRAYEIADRRERPWIYETSRPQSARVLCLAGDGIGREVMAQTKRVVEWFQNKREVALELHEEPYGIDAWRAHGALMTENLWTKIRSADAILFGASGSPEYEGIPRDLWLPDNLLRIRRDLDLFANLRPIRMATALKGISSLRPELTEGVDLLVIRELGGGLYFGEPRGISRLERGGRRAVNSMIYTSEEIGRIARIAFEQARGRRGQVCSVDKANVLEVSMLWREVVQSVRDAEYPDIELRHMYVDNAAMQLVVQPTQFDVLLTENLFGDILSDCAATLAGSIGMLPSASLGSPDARGRRRALYEPIHGSAPDIAGRGIANPLGSILSFAMCLRFTLELPQEARLLEDAVDKAITEVGRTADIAAADEIPISTDAMGTAVITSLDAALATTS